MIRIRKGAWPVLACLALGASCSSVIKGQSAEYKRGPDEARPICDHGLYVKNRETGADFRLAPRNYKLALAIAPLREEFRRQPEPNGEPRSNFATRPPESPIEDDGRGADGAIRPEAKPSESDRRFGFDVKTLAERAAEAPVTTASTAGSVGSSTPPGNLNPAEEPRAPGTPAPETPRPPETPAPETPKPETPKPPETPAPETPKPPEQAPPAPTPQAPPAEEERPKRVGFSGVKEHHFGATGAPDSSPDAVARLSSRTDPERDRRIAEISEKDGMNFSIDSSRFQQRMEKLLQKEYLVFEHVTSVDYGDKKTLEGLLEQADARKADLLLVCTLRRNKVSYRGADLGPAALDNILEFLFLVNEFWSPIHREQYECDVELRAQLYDVRSHYCVLDQTFEGHDTLVLSTAQRSWHPMRNWISWLGVDVNREGLFSDTGEYVRPGAWMDMEVKLLDNFQNTLKGVIDSEHFDEVTNQTYDAEGRNALLKDKLEPRRQIALVAGVSEYGEKARARLREWAAGSVDAAAQDRAEKELGERYEGQQVKLGTRPYAEEDAKKVVDLLTRPYALGSGASGVLAANLYAEIGKDATIENLRTAFRQVARARKDDQVFVYLNGETLVVEDPTRPDKVLEYFLPYDIDLDEVERRWKEGLRSLEDYLDEKALSFDWIDSCFYRDSIQDHIFLQSRHALVVVDCPFPGLATRDRFSPERARREMLPALPGTELPLKAPDVAPVVTGDAAAVSSESAPSTTTGFLERIAQGGLGRFVVLTTGPDERPLDIPSVKQGGFVYFFTQFLDPTKQDRFKKLRTEKGDVLARDIVAYAKDRLEAESRQAGRPQHVLTFGDREHDFVLLSEQR